MVKQKTRNITLESESKDRTDFLQWLDTYLGPDTQTINGPNAYDIAIGIANQ
jgi:hypothetical protein